MNVLRLNVMVVAVSHVRSRPVLDCRSCQVVRLSVTHPVVPVSRGTLAVHLVRRSGRQYNQKLAGNAAANRRPSNPSRTTAARPPRAQPNSSASSSSDRTPHPSFPSLVCQLPLHSERPPPRPLRTPRQLRHLVVATFYTAHPFGLRPRSPRNRSTASSVSAIDNDDIAECNGHNIRQHTASAETCW